MALIKCVECGKKISDKALSCPFCGNPINNQNNKPTLIEQTGKRWKIVLLSSWLLIIAGWIIFFSQFENGGFANPFTGFGFSVGFFGIILLFVGKIGAWWSHR